MGQTKVMGYGTAAHSIWGTLQKKIKKYFIKFEFISYKIYFKKKTVLFLYLKLKFKISDIRLRRNKLLIIL